MRLDLGIQAGDESKKFLVGLTQVVDRLEKVAAKLVKTGATTDDEEDTVEASDDEDEDFGSKKTKGKKAAFDEDEDTELSSDDASEDEDEEEEESEDEDEEESEDEEVEEKTTKKAGKQKKLTINDVNDACKLRAKRAGGKDGREQVLKILKKKFKTTTVSEIDEKLWPKVIAAMRE